MSDAKILIYFLTKLAKNVLFWFITDGNVHSYGTRFPSACKLYLFLLIYTVNIQVVIQKHASRRRNVLHQDSASRLAMPSV